MIKNLLYALPLVAAGALAPQEKSTSARALIKTTHTAEIPQDTLTQLQAIADTLVPTQQAITRGTQHVAVISVGGLIAYFSIKTGYTGITDEKLTTRERAVRTAIGLGGLGVGLTLIAKAPELVARFCNQ